MFLYQQTLSDATHNIFGVSFSLDSMYLGVCSSDFKARIYELGSSLTLQETHSDATSGLIDCQFSTGIFVTGGSD